MKSLKPTQQDFRKAVLEAIFWWQRSEYKYSISIRNAFDKYQSESDIRLFVKDSFYSFSTDYSIRRTLKGTGDEPVVLYLKECFSKGGLMENLLKEKDKGKVIDEFVKSIANKKDLSSGNKLTSLISKTAFLFMPEQLPLYDQLTKTSLEKHFGIISSFPMYLTFFEKQKLEWKGKIENAVEDMLHLTTQFSEFNEIQDVRSFLVHRTVDKMLWLQGKGMK